MFLYASPPTPALWCICSPWQLLESSVAVAFESGSSWQCVLQSWVSSPLASGAASKLTTPIRAQNWSALLWIECSCSPTKSMCSKLTLGWWCQEVRSLGGDEATRVEPPWWDKWPYKGDPTEPPHPFIQVRMRWEDASFYSSHNYHVSLLLWTSWNSADDKKKKCRLPSTLDLLGNWDVHLRSYFQHMKNILEIHVAIFTGQ